MTLVWIGTAVFILGVLIRNYYKIKYYNDFKKNAHTELQRQELKSKYRPSIYIGLAIEVLGVILMFTDILINK